MSLLADARLRVRRPTLADAPLVVDLINAADRHDYGVQDTDLDDILQEFAEMNLETDAWLVEQDDGRAVAFAAIASGVPVKLYALLFVVPEARRQGIGTALSDLVETRARELVDRAPADARVVLNSAIKGGSDPELRWARRLGYEVERTFLKMQIELDAPPPAPVWPEGIELRTMEVGRDERTFFETLNESFADHWGFVPGPYERFLRRTARSDFDPELWFMAWDGEQPAAFAICEPMGEDRGWVASLGVRRPWRQRGIARALLVHAFGEFWRRGRRTVALGVDADSLTGATRLYESAGMHLQERHDQVVKVLREGRDARVQSLDSTAG